MNPSVYEDVICCKRRIMVGLEQWDFKEAIKTDQQIKSEFSSILCLFLFHRDPQMHHIKKWT